MANPLNPYALNPYAPPVAQDESGGNPSSSANPEGYQYRSIGPIAQIITVVTALIALVELASLANSQLGVEALTSVAAGVAVSQQQLSAIDGLARAIGVATLALLIINAIAFCFLMPRANRNARALGVSPLTFSPGMAAGSFFIPFLNLYQPYQVMKELWQACENDPHTPWHYMPVSGLLPLWWASWVGSNVIAQIVGWLEKEATSPDGYVTAMRANQISSVGTIVACVLVMLVVRGLWRRQERRREIAGPSEAR